MAVNRTAITANTGAPTRKRLPVVRGDCITGTRLTGSLEERMSGRAQCQVLHCPKHLLTTASANMPGRRHRGLAPPLAPSGDVASAFAPSCALDIADATPNGMSSREVARHLGITKRKVELDVKSALEKLRAGGAAEADVDALTVAAFAHPQGNGVV